MKLPMNADSYSIGFVSETIWRRIVSGATGTRATIIKWPLGGLSNLFIFISASIQYKADMYVLKYRALRADQSEKLELTEHPG